MEYYEQLKDSCLSTGSTAMERAARRTEEIQSLKEAMDLLETGTPWRWRPANAEGQKGAAGMERFGYGSIPIHTIFSGMNIHLPAILMFTRGTRVLTHPHFKAGWRTQIFDVLRIGMMGDLEILTCQKRSGSNDLGKASRFLSGTRDHL